MTEMNREELYQIGAVTRAHGVHGEMKVFPMTDDPLRFRGMKELILDTGKELKICEVADARLQKNLVILKIRGIDTMDEAERLRGCGFYVTKENRVPLGEDEWFIADLIGCAVRSDEGEDLGILTDVLATGANDVYVVEKEGEKELLIPSIRECILDVDTEGKQVLVHLLKGLRE